MCIHVNACTCVWCVGDTSCVSVKEAAYKVKFSGGGLEAVESEGEGDGGILHF